MFFGMRASALSDVFWEVIETFLAERGALAEGFRSDLMLERAHFYAEAIHAKGHHLTIASAS